MAVPTTNELSRIRRMNPVASSVRLDLMLQYMDTATGYYTGAVAGVTGTTGTSFAINSDSSTPKVAFSVPDTGTGNYTLTLAAPASLGASRSVAFPDPGAGTFYWAVTTNSNGSVATTASTGTTNATFLTYSGSGKPQIELAGQAAGTGNFKVTLQPASTLTASRAITFADSAGTVALTSAKQSLTLLGSTDGGIVLSPTATGSFNTTIANQSMAAARTITLPDPAADSKYFAITANADGSVTTTASTGTTNATFTVGSTLLVLSSTGQTGAHTFTYPDSTGVVVTEAATQVLTGKTLTAPTINAAALTGNLTISGSPTILGTWTNLGTVTTVDINGGTADSVIIGGATPAAITGTTITGTTITDGNFSLNTGAVTGIRAVTSASGSYAWDLSGSTGALTTPSGTNTLGGNVVGSAGKTFDFSASNTTFKTSTGTNTLGGNAVIADGKTLKIGSATAGVANALQLYSATGANGSLILHQPDNAGNFAATLQPVSTLGQATAFTLPDPGAATANIVLDAGAQTIAGVKTFSSNPVVSGIDAGDSTLAITGRVGSASAGGSVTLTAGAGAGASQLGGLITLTTGAGVNGAAAAAGSAPGTATVTCGAAGTANTGTGGTGGTIAITSTAGGASTGAAGVGGTGGGITLTTGAGGADGEGGSGTGGVGGTLALVAGAGGAGATKGNGGPITLTAGQAGGAAATGGGATIDAGAANGGTAGAILIGGTNAESVTLGRSTKVTRALGTFRADSIASGASATAGSLIIYPTTATNGSLTITCTDTGGDRALSITNAAQTAAAAWTIPDTNGAASFMMTKGSSTVTGTVNLSGATVTYRSIVDGDITTGTITRAKLAEEALAKYGVSLVNLRNNNGTVMTATPGAGLFNITSAGFGTGTLTLDCPVASGASTTGTLMFEFEMPVEYVTAGDVKLIVTAKESVGAATVSTTLSSEVYESDGQGGVSAIAGSWDQTDVTVAWQTFTNTLTAASLTAGDKLRVFVRIVTDDTGATVGTIAQVGKIEMQCDIKG